MSGKLPMEHCDFCYLGETEWAAQFINVKLTRIPGAEWHFAICDSCRLLLRNVIGPILHRLNHSQVVGALVAKMDELGITYDDLMDTSWLNPPQINAPPPKAIEQNLENK